MPVGVVIVLMAGVPPAAPGLRQPATSGSSSAPVTSKLGTTAVRIISVACAFVIGGAAKHLLAAGADLARDFGQSGVDGL